MSAATVRLFLVDGFCPCYHPVGAVNLLSLALPSGAPPWTRAVPSWSSKVIEP